MNDRDVIARNARVHDAVIARYERKHGEIFNVREQERLRALLERACGEIRGASTPFYALDVGAGSGNLTKHLVDLGCDVVAADVSPKALEFVRSRFSTIEISVLNGEDLSQWSDGTFDVVAAYSVLHHVPDYFSLVKEMVRVLRSGGVLLIDHEHALPYWDKTSVYAEFAQKMKYLRKKDWRKFLDPRRYYHFVRRMIHPRYQAEGDIHVFSDDHIDWIALEHVLQSMGCEVVRAEDYLAYQAGYDDALYALYAKRCADMRYVLARKK